MIFLKKCYFPTTTGLDCIAMTHEVHYCIRDAKIPSGVVTMVVPHPEAGLLVGEALPEVIDALKAHFTQWGAPCAEQTARDPRRGKVPVASLLQSALAGRVLHCPFEKGQLCLDPHSDLLLWDFSARVQRREVIVQVFGDAAAPQPGSGQAGMPPPQPMQGGA